MQDIDYTEIILHMLENRHLNYDTFAVEYDAQMDELVFHYLGTNSSFVEEPEHLLGYFKYSHIEDWFPEEFQTDDRGTYLTNPEYGPGIEAIHDRAYIDHWGVFLGYVIDSWDLTPLYEFIEHKITENRRR